MRTLAKKCLLPILLAPWIAGCVNDGAAMLIDGPNHAISLLRAQPRFWEKKVELEIIVARIPDCQRRHTLQPVNAAPDFRIDVYSPGPDTYLLVEGRNVYLTETQTCLGFQRLDADPPGGRGDLLGSFREENGALIFAATAPAGAGN